MKFNQFRDIEHRPLRIYNRAVMFHNIYEDHGIGAAEEYVATFSPQEKLEIAQITALVKTKGTKFVKDLVTQGVDFPDNMPEGL